MVGLGVTQVRLTGGEPLLRRSLVDVVAGSPPSSRGPDRDDDQRHRPRPARRPAGRRRAWTGSTSASTPSTPSTSAGSPGVTGSATSWPASRPPRIAGLTPVKVNAVAMRGVNDADVARPAAVVPRPGLRPAVHRADAARRPARLGPLDQMVPQTEILERLGERFRSPRWPTTRGAPRPSCSSSTAARPPSASSPACRRRSAAACDRVRLTADGQLRNCLFARREVDLRGPMRAGATDEELADLVIAEMWGKKSGSRHRATPASSSPTARCQRSVAELGRARRVPG